MLVIQLKKTDYDTKCTEIEKKLTDHYHHLDEYIITSEFKNLATEDFDVRLKQVNSVTKTDFDDELRSLNQKINSNKKKHLVVENEFKKIKTFDLDYFRGKNHFEEMVYKVIQYFSQCKDIFKKLTILIMFYHGNLKDCSMELLNLLLNLIIVLLQH